jgi:hypothetical protein
MCGDLPGQAGFCIFHLGEPLTLASPIPPFSTASTLVPGPCFDLVAVRHVSLHMLTGQ